MTEREAVGNMTECFSKYGVMSFLTPPLFSYRNFHANSGLPNSQKSLCVRPIPTDNRSCESNHVVYLFDCLWVRAFLEVEAKR